MKHWLTILGVALLSLLAPDAPAAEGDTPAAPDAQASEAPAEPVATFAESVDLTPLDRIAVQWEGRVKSFYSLARETTGGITGPRGLEGQSPVFTYLDLMFRPESYHHRDMVYVKNQAMRGEIANQLLEARAVDEAWAEHFTSRGQISFALITRPDVQNQIEVFRRDLLRTAKFVNQIDFAFFLAQPSTLMDRMRILPPTGASENDRWLTIEAFNQPPMQPVTGVPIDPDLREPLHLHWSKLRLAWLQEDAATVNTELAAFCDLLPQIAHDIYPDQDRLGWESWYFRAGSMTWSWLIYLLATMFLLGAVVYRWRTARWIG
ncbi:MAG: hypothetical protein KDA21_11620, partial [Phycisphaerales bacterium]|nr:hypothetical protein [Phycisphaerales bacterium]